MTAWPRLLDEMRLHGRAWPRAGRFLLAAMAVLFFACTGVVRADDPVRGEVRVYNERGFARLVFRLDETVDAKVRVSGAIIVIEFKKPVAVAVDRMNSGAPDYISAARSDPDGSAIRIALAQKVKVNSIPAAERLYVDLLPESWTGTMPGLPQDVVDELANRARLAERQLHKQRLTAQQKTTPDVRVKVAKLPTFMRYVFQLPDGVDVVPERRDGRIVLNFDRQIKWDLADAHATRPSTLESIAAEADFDSVAVVFQLNGTPEVRSFREDRSIVVDIGIDGSAPGPATERASPSAMAASETGPAIEPPETVPAKDAPAQPIKPASMPASAPMAAPPPPPMKDSAAPPAAPQPPKAEAAAPEPKMAAVPPPVKAEKPDAAPRGTADKAPQAPAMARPVVVPDAPKIMSEPAAAAGKPPAADPNAPVVAVVNQTGENLRIDFPFAVPTPAAVFRRADMLWMVFDSAAKIDLAALARSSTRTIRRAEFSRGAGGEAIVRIRLARPLLTSLSADGPGWIVNIGETVTTPTRPLAIAREVGGNQTSVVVPFDNADKVHRLVDPEAGDQLMVITALAPARGFLKAQDFIELHALSSTHGVVVRPVADDLITEIEADKITISRPAGLSLSAIAADEQQQQQLVPGFRALTFDTQVWGFDRQAPFVARQSELMRLAAAATPAKKRLARFNLARFYLAHEMAAEARAVLDVALSDQHGTEDVTGTVLKAVADVMMSRPERALKELASPQVADQQDAPIWRAIAYARQGKWPEAHASFKEVGNAMRVLPIELQRMVMQEEMRAAIEMRDFTGAMRVASEFETMGVPAELEPAVAVLTGRLYQSLGRNEDALTSYRVAAASQDRPASAQGRLREIALLLKSTDMPRNEVIHELETLTTVWRGDETESEGLQLLARLYTEDNRYRDAFHVMRTALLAHPNSDMTRKIQDEAAATFDSLFLSGKGDVLPPIEALGLFYDFRELTPIGRRGDEMIRRLADRLVGVDLLDQAAELLQHQVDHRLHGAARAQVATRLATVYLMGRKPDRALATLQKTRMSDLANELRDQRLLLEARAMSDIGRHALALEVIANIKGREAIRLRATILWTAKQWRRASEQIELLYGDRWREFAPLNETERSDILRAAIGYALGEEQIGLLRLREKYAAKMADGPDRRAFDVVSTPIGTSGPEFLDVARKMAAVDTLDAFLRDLSKRYPDQPMPDSPAPAKDNKPMAAPPSAAKKADAPAVAAKDGAKEAAKTPATPAESSLLPPKPPVGTPLKPDRMPTGSIRSGSQRTNLSR